MLLSVFLGSGTQILCMAGITLVFACLGFLSPANRGALMTCAMVLFVCLGTPAGYVSARIYKSFGGEKWKSNVLLTSMLCPGIVFAHFFVMNLVLWYEGSSAAIPFFTLVALLALWFGVSVPLTFVGAFFGFRKRAIGNLFFTKMGEFWQKPAVELPQLWQFNTKFVNFEFFLQNILCAPIRSLGRSPNKVFIPNLSPALSWAVSCLLDASLSNFSLF